MSKKVTFIFLITCFSFNRYLPEFHVAGKVLSPTYAAVLSKKTVNRWGGIEWKVVL